MSLLRSRAAQLAGLIGVVLVLFFTFGLPSEDQTKQWKQHLSSKLKINKTPSDLENVPKHLRDVYNETLGVRASFISESAEC